MVDGEHYPPVIQDALDDLAAQGHEIVGAVLAGGTEKLPSGGLSELEGVEVRQGPSPERALAAAVRELGPEGVMDLSDEPVLDYRRRHLFASIALAMGVRYDGPGFSFAPPDRPPLARRPSVAVVSTGKRTGKTAVAGSMARCLVEGGRSPAIVAMGRGGPAEPEVLRGDQIELGPEQLLELVASGKHAASDYVEDALLARVPTVGCRRCGGGLAGSVGVSNVAQGVELANELDADILLLEGSGSAVPPVGADAGVLVVPANVPDEYVSGYFGPLRLLLADVVVVTMAEEPFGSASRVASLIERIREVLASVHDEGAPEVQVVRTVFRPAPTRSVTDASVCVATTAPSSVGESITHHLEREQGCRVVGITHALSNRAQLEPELEDIMRGADVLLCEIKAAGIDVATKKAMEKGLEVVYMNNVPTGVEGDDPAAAFVEVAGKATDRFAERT